MAKLSAHGRKIAQVEKVTETPDDRLVIWKRVSYTLMEDGVVLKKVDVRFRPNPAAGEEASSPHSYGWKIAKKEPPNSLSPGQRCDVFVQAFVSAGFEVVA